MTIGDIDAVINDTRSRLKLSWGLNQATYDEKGARDLIAACHQAVTLRYEEGVGCAMMFLGRLLEIKKDFLGARIFYLVSKTIFRQLESMNWVPAKEYHSECPKGDRECGKAYADLKPLVETGKISSAELIKQHFGDLPGPVSNQG